VAASLAGAIARQEESARRDGESAGRDAVIGRLALRWLRAVLLVATVQAVIWVAVASAAQAGNGTGVSLPLLTGLLVFATGVSAASLGAVLVCWRPGRWVPRLRGLIILGAFLGCVTALNGLSGPVGSPDVSGMPGNWSSLLFAPAAVMSAGAGVLLCVSCRMRPAARTTFYQRLQYGKRATPGQRAGGESRMTRENGPGHGHP